MSAAWPRLVLLAAVAGCDSLPPAPRGAATASALAPTSAAPAPTAAPPAPPRPAASPTSPTVVQVEVSGRLTLPAGAPRGRSVVVLGDGPCFQPGTHALAVVDADATGAFQATLYPPVGTELEACGALVEPRRSGLSFWGRADRGSMPVHGRGKMVYGDTAITLRRGKEVPLPPGVKFEAARAPAGARR